MESEGDDRAMTINVSTKWKYINRVIESIIHALRHDEQVEIKHDISNLHVIAMQEDDFEFMEKVESWLIHHDRHQIAKMIRDHAFEIYTPDDGGAIKEIFWFIIVNQHERFGFSFPIRKWIVLLRDLLEANYKDMGKGKRALIFNEEREKHSIIDVLLDKVGKRMIEIGEEWEDG